ncbi:hypothetical protein DXA97_07610 [Clostridium sp. OF09-36]|nr:hypothetical protein DXA97_07610 [Clostridium sp. OF09-36]
MIIHVKPDKNHRPTYIYENEPVNRHPNLPPGAITVGDVFHFIGRFIKGIITAIQMIIAIAVLAYVLFFSRIHKSSTDIHTPNGIIVNAP